MLRTQIILLATSGCLLVCCNRPEGSGSMSDAGIDLRDPSGDMIRVTDSGQAADAQSTSDAATSTPLAVINPSFESPATNPGTFITSAPPTGWQAYGNINNGNRATGVLNPSSTTLYLDRPPHGSNVGVVFLLDRPMEQSFYANSEAGLQQTLTATLQPDSEYTLSVHVGNINTDTSPSHRYEFLGFPGYRIDLLAGGQVLASDTNSLRPGEGRFLQSTVRFATGSQHALLGLALGIRLVNLNSSVGIEVNFDDVRLERTAR
jgi:hypothetical protein